MKYNKRYTKKKKKKKKNKDTSAIKRREKYKQVEKRRTHEEEYKRKTIQEHTSTNKDKKIWSQKIWVNKEEQIYILKKKKLKE